MKLIKTFAFALFLLSTSFNYATNFPQMVISTDIPAKTIILKYPAAANINQYFASATMVTFEVYKAGTKADLAQIITSLKSNKVIASCSEGILTGDYQAITITLTVAQNKAWFISLFKAAGLNTIKVNADPIIEVEKL